MLTIVCGGTKTIQPLRVQSLCLTLAFWVFVIEYVVFVFPFGEGEHRDIKMDVLCASYRGGRELAAGKKEEFHMLLAQTESALCTVCLSTLQFSV